MAASLVPTEGGNPIPLDKPIVLIGRHQECDVSLLMSSKVSRRHCCIVQAGDRFLVRDLGSMNGVRVNGHRVVETELRSGDEVTVADVAFEFRRDDSPAGAKGVQSARRGSRPAIRDVASAIPLAMGDTPDDAEEEAAEVYQDPLLHPDGGKARRQSDSHSESGFVRV